MNYSKIVATGSYLPEKVLTNEDLASIVETSDEWIVERTGIHCRHIAAENETPASMAAEASLQALNLHHIDPQTIDLIIVATCTSTHFFPSTACQLQQQLKISSCIAFDISAACTGFIYALSIADQYVRSGMVKRALVVGSETMSRVVDWKDRATCVLFGDGAGAVVIERSDEPGIIASKLFADGAKGDLLSLPTGVSPGLPGLSEMAPHAWPFVQMKGRALFKDAVVSMGEAINSLLEDNHYSFQDLDWIVPHQANLRIIDAIISKLSIPKEKVIVTVGEQANTSGASIPLALDSAFKDGRIQPGHQVLLEAFGGGLTWGSLLFRT
ncbi:MAG: beta-ketoacyl-ACP synthase III [Pseudomonadota bacterium]|nr:ketoacyl-ACP synthase III [Gammaproteobacteria bacterium]MBU1559069.1 ketoacyl-ACP synthase III [Gammaproteobacteria bacterium]MBU1926320.1 ketoacyl-ACP synthase III [Gammaproteobacteria bacterium]MBU2546236.1 ketoacyl-ACP synthase III [Gammaproteobacteria bacterium]